MHADGVDLADAVDLDHVALHARHHCPDVQEGQDGEEDAPDQRQRDAHQRRQQPVEPVLADRERGEAGFPHTVEAVGACRLSDHVLEVHLHGHQEKTVSVSIATHPKLVNSSSKNRTICFFIGQTKRMEIKDKLT